MELNFNLQYHITPFPAVSLHDVSPNNSHTPPPLRMAQAGLTRSLLSWLTRLVAVLFVIWVSPTVLGSFGLSRDTPGDFSATNPWRDLPSDPAVHDTLKEVLLIGDTLRDGLLPTSLPDDDYDTYSTMLLSLEGREDLTWLIIQETGIDKTIMAIANRGGHHSPIPEEPHDLHERVKRLHDHWWALTSAKDKPERWETRFDTTYLPSLLTGKALDSSEKLKGFKLDLTPAQKAEAEAKYKAYRQRRDRAVAYLKKNPPKPMAWVPIDSAPEKAQGIWGTIFHDGIIQAGRKVLGKQMAANPMFKPIYRDLTTERIPYGWVDPSQPVEEFSEQDHLREMEAFREESRLREERTDRQAKFQEELRAEERRQRGDKEEL
ncbi:hypothetical protein CkaCkLH20_00583 [Colletotrichum karsti]|uniref:Uncharacterized protein n=1 Tax=Colletotrichum karsti TaxID=1095194 RepID=A0A9P6IFG5_9PEZI|nr:uncharacterized protein CkaCkLH20_00583 [Colletotrichum karsti]KAF9881437.1 hypothetical protein CkaCkLH20_00583 [Colletotrichum karsti]